MVCAALITIAFKILLYVSGKFLFSDSGSTHSFATNSNLISLPISSASFGETNKILGSVVISSIIAALYFGLCVQNKWSLLLPFAKDNQPCKNG